MTQIASIDWNAQRFHLHADTVTNGFDAWVAFAEIRATIEANLSNDQNFKLFIHRQGKATKGGGAFTPKYVSFLPGWRAVPYALVAHGLDLITEMVSDDLLVDKAMFDRTGVTVNVDIDSVYDQVEIITAEGGSGASAAEIWSYASRTLTSASGPTAQDVADAVWANVTRTLSEAAGVTAQDILDISTQVWTEATRTLTSAPGVTPQDIIDIKDAVWSATIRTLTEAAGLTPTQSLQLEEMHGQVDRTVFYDADEPSNGKGYRGDPFNLIGDTITYAENNHIRTIQTFSNITLSKALKNLIVQGSATTEFDPAGYSLKGTELWHLKIVGAASGADPFITQQCEIAADAGIFGYAERCVFTGNCSVVGHTHIVDGKSGAPGEGFIWVDTNGFAVQFTNWRRSLGISNMTAGIHTIEMYAGQLHADVGCTGGTIFLRGDYSKAPDNLGAVTIIDQTNLAGQLAVIPAAVWAEAVRTLTDPAGLTVEQETKLTELWQLQGLDKDNPMTVTQTDRIVAAIHIIFSGDGVTSTTSTRQP